MSAPEPLARALEPLFQLLLRLERDQDLWRDQDRLHEHCCAEVERFRAEAERLGIKKNDADAACLALASRIDELATLRDGSLREYWQPRALVVRYFDEPATSAAFFERLASLRGDDARQHVLRVFYVCLLLGFKGKHRSRSGEVELLEIEEGVRAELQRTGALPSALLLSPHGTPPYEKLLDVRRQSRWPLLVAAAAVVSLLSCLGLRLALVHETQELVDRMGVALEK